MSDKYTRIYANSYRQSIASRSQMITVQVFLPFVYQALVQLGLEVKIVKIEEGREVEISLQEAINADYEEVNLELQILNLAESEVLTQKRWYELIEGWGGKIERY